MMRLRDLRDFCAFTVRDPQADLESSILSLGGNVSMACIR